mmetsp:Transcript_972/g.2097  ORF Transcript_972/g.2097 Transcript_972/m.2097 type:complete len:100 (+) Transcript_972:339-638(+)
MRTGKERGETWTWTWEEQEKTRSVMREQRERQERAWKGGKEREREDACILSTFYLPSLVRSFGLPSAADEWIDGCMNMRCDGRNARVKGGGGAAMIDMC